MRIVNTSQKNPVPYRLDHSDSYRLDPADSSLQQDTAGFLLGALLVVEGLLLAGLLGLNLNSLLTWLAL